MRRRRIKCGCQLIMFCIGSDMVKEQHLEMLHAAIPAVGLVRMQCAICACSNDVSWEHSCVL